MGPLIVISNYRIHVPAKTVSTIVRNSCKSLLVEWQEIRPTQPLTIEFQDLLLAFINKPPIEDGTVGHTSRLTVTKERPMSAPQRFRRSQYGATVLPVNVAKQQQGHLPLSPNIQSSMAEIVFCFSVRSWG